jgi:hypothetical protein
VITLTNPIPVVLALGGNTNALYNITVLAPLTADVVRQTCAGTVRITSSANPEMQPVLGSLVIDTNAATVQLRIDKFDYDRTITLNASGITYVRNAMATFQQALETGLVNIGMVTGVASAGA